MALKTINTLIRLHKRRVEVIRREMVALEEERRQLLHVADNLRREYEREAALASEDPKLSGFFGSYSARVKLRQENIAKEVKRLDAAIEEKRNAVLEEFSEQKKYEIAGEQAKKRLAVVAQRRQQERFDEIGSQQYNKTKDNPL